MQVPVRQGVNSWQQSQWLQTYCKAREAATLAYLVRVLDLALEK